MSPPLTFVRAGGVWYGSRVVPYQARIFLSGARDVGPLLEQAHSVCRLLAADAARRNQRLEPFYWDKSDIQWTHDATFQEKIPRLSPDDTAAAVFIFGERVGSRLPRHFPLPSDFQVPSDVAWRDLHAGAPLGLTGTLDQYLDCLQQNQRASAAGRPSTPMLVYFIGREATIADQSLAPLRRGWGGVRLYRRLVQEGDPFDAKTALVEYRGSNPGPRHVFRYIHPLDSPGREALRPVTFLERVDDFPELLNRDLRRLLSVRAVQSVETAVKGMQAYTAADHYCFFGRSRDAHSLVEQLHRRDEASRPTLAVVESVSGVGKSSFAAAGLVGGVRARKFAEYQVDLVGQIITPQQLVDDVSRRGDFALGPDTILAEFMSRLCDAEVELRFGDEAEIRPLFAGLSPSQALALAALRVRSALDRLPRAAGSPATIDGRRRLVLVVDQCERLVDDLRSNGAEAGLWATLVQLLVQLADERLAWVVLVLPDSRHQAWIEVPELQRRADLFVLRNPDRRDLEQIISGLADTVGAILDNELTLALTDSVEALAAPGVVSKGESTRAPLLPVLSLGMKRLLAEWNRRRTLSIGMSSGADGQASLDYSAYKSFANLSDVIELLGEAAWQAALGGRAVVDEEELLGRVLRRLVSMAGPDLRRLDSCSRAAMMSDTDPNVALLVAALLERRLIISLEGDALRLVHEVVLDKWPRAKAWYDVHRDDLRDLALLQANVDRWAGQSEAIRFKYLERNPVPLRFAGYALSEWPDRISPQMREYVVQSLLSFYDPAEDTPSPRSGSTLVTFAASLNDRELLDHYVRVAGTSDILHRRPWSALDGAVWGDHPELVQWCLDGGAGVDGVATLSGWTTLHLAAYRGSVQSTPILLASRPDLASVLEDGKTPLLVAAERGHEEIVRMLVNAGADVTHRGATGDTILHLAARMGHHRVIDVVVAECREKVAALTAVTSPSGEAALHLAVRQRSVDTVVALLRGGTPVEFPASTQASPTLLAVRTGSWEIASLLVAHGGELPPRLSKARLAKLTMASRAGRVSLVPGDFAPDLVEPGIWAERPAYGGSGWQDLSNTEAAALLTRFANEQLDRAEPSEALLYEIRRVPIRSLACYPGHRLVECEVRRQDVRVASFLFVEGPAGCVPLDLSNRPIYQMNAEGRLDLSADAQVADYIRFFFGAVAGRHGRFILAETVEDIPWTRAATSSDREGLARRLQYLEPWREERDGREIFVTRATMVFKDSLFIATITITREGIAGLDEEELLVDDGLPVRLERIEGTLRYTLDCGALAYRPADDAGLDPTPGGELGNVNAYPWAPAPMEAVAEMIDSMRSADLERLAPLDAVGCVRCRLPWHRSIYLYRVLHPTLVADGVFWCYLVTPDAGLFRLEGNAAPIHEVNAKFPLSLGASNVLDYLRFFGFFVRGEAGPFYVVEQPEDLGLSTGDPLLAVVANAVRPAELVETTEDGGYRCRAVIWYSNVLLRSQFMVQPNGMIQMEWDETIVDDLGVRPGMPLQPQ